MNHPKPTIKHYSNRLDYQMIYELSNTEYKNVFSTAKYYNIEIPAVLSGNSFGKVFADSRMSPETALIWTKDGMFFAGDPHNNSFNSDFNRFANEELLLINESFNIKWLTICCTNKDWEDQIRSLYKDKDLRFSNQLVYRMNIKDFNYLSDGESDEYKIVKMNERLFAQSLISRDIVLQDIIDFWDSLDFFYKNGFGFAIIKDNRIISTCSVNFIYKNTCTLGVWTDKAYRGQGYAKLVVSHMLSYMKDRGLHPYWDCMEKNSASRALAQSLGFRLDYKYKLIEFKL